jgi:hypothetical protein
MPTPQEAHQLPPTEDIATFTNEEIIFLLRALWDSLQSPGWTFKNRKDLEKIGEAIFSGKKLKELDDALYDRIFPHLKTVAIHLGKILRNSQSETAEAPKAPPKTTPVLAGEESGVASGKPPTPESA